MGVFTLEARRIRRLVEELYHGSIARLALALPLARPPDRSTVNRWITSGGRHFPSSEERVLALAGALDVDPVALWSFDPENFGVLWPKIVRAAQRDRWAGLLKPLSFLRHYAAEHDEWPPQEIAQRYHGRRFTVFEFEHDPRRRANFYQRILLAPQRRARPVVWHLAFRHAAGVHHPRWRPYGFVVWDLDRAMLFSDWALARQTPAAPELQELTVETWCGQGPAIFRVASLHRFAATLQAEAPPGVPTLRFGFPGEPD
jgi:hypothetical protein